MNDPYKGVELVRRHGRPEAGRHSLQIEIKRTLYMDEVTLVPNAGYEGLARHLESLVATLAGYALERSARRRSEIGLTT